MAIVWDYPGEPVPEETFTTASQNIQRQQQEAPPNNEYFRLLAVSCITQHKGKVCYSHEECRWGAHLPFLGLEPAGG